MIEISEYFDGKVKSMAFQGAKLPATVGVMEPGKFTFSTSQHEVMTVIDGLLKVKLPDESEFRDYHSGDSFEVPANSSFDVEITQTTAYHCTYS